MMKRLLILFLLQYSIFSTYADEGMWIPLMLKMKEAALKAEGLKISADEIYSNDNPSLKDAVVQFGGGCTGEVISNQGLILTNHHCGRSMIQSLSTLEKNYFENGFWAYKKSEELPCPGLYVTFVVRIENVTDSIIPFLTANLSEEQRIAKAKEIGSRLERNAVQGTHYKASVKPFYNGNEYYLFVTEVFNDIRLVGAPPAAIGKFGGDTDNWMWPRHTGDFSLFRIYADPANNKPAAYSPNNVPFKPRKSFPISMKGINEDDFTMVYGFPGSTKEYIPSQAVELVQEVSDPSKVKIRDAKLDIWRKKIAENDTIRLKYISKYYTISNYWKKWDGEMQGLRKSNAVQMKRDEEKKFVEWVNVDASRRKQYGYLLHSFDSLYKLLTPLSKLNDYNAEALNGIELISFINTNIQPLAELAKDDKISNDSLKSAASKVYKSVLGFYKNYSANVDKEVMASLLKLFHNDIPAEYSPSAYEEIKSKYKEDYVKYADRIYSKTVFADSVKLKSFLDNFNHKSLRSLQKDLAYILARNIADNYTHKAADQYARLNSEINLLQRSYMKAQMEMSGDVKLYPDANLTLRVATGKIKGYHPRDGVNYSYYSTLDGIMEKHNPNSDEFNVPPKLRELYAKKDFGRYAVNGTVPVAFIADCHTTGGNSGSPAINAKGELIGANFDTVWEGTLSDIHYNPDRSRNISVDIRFILFIVDKYGGAKNIIDELNLVE
jgi:hypothetical protein